CRELIVLAVREAEFDRDILACKVADVLQSPTDRGHNGRFGLRRAATQISDHRQSRLLRPRSARPRRRAAEQRDELAALHSITSSARARTVGGTVRPSALAVLRLRIVSYLVGACTGRSPGFSPLRTRST